MTFKDFMAGKKGWAHSAQEFGTWAFLIGFSGWLISPFFAVLIVLILTWQFPKYWEKRELKQSLSMVEQGRRNPPTKKDLEGIPKEPTDFWKQDAIDDVEHPNKCRIAFIIASFAYIGWLINTMGFFGIWALKFFVPS